jgi:hypothetical protein
MAAFANQETTFIKRLSPIIHILKHHLDSNVITGIFKFRNEETQLDCTRYCDSIGRHYEDSISIVAAGEVVKQFGLIPEVR